MLNTIKLNLEMNLGNDKAFILFVEFFGNFPTPKETFLKEYIYIICLWRKKERIFFKVLGEYSIFNMESSNLVIYLIIYLIYLFDMGCVCVCVCVCWRCAWVSTMVPKPFFFFFFPLKIFFKKKGKQAVTSIWHENMWGFSWPHAKSQQCNAMQCTAHKRLTIL